MEASYAVQNTSSKYLNTKTLVRTRLQKIDYLGSSWQDELGCGVEAEK